MSNAGHWRAPQRRNRARPGTTRPGRTQLAIGSLQAWKRLGMALPLLLYFQSLGLYDTSIGLIWVYRLITLPLALWIVRGYFEEVSKDIELAYRLDGHSWLSTFFRISILLARPGIAAAGLLSFIALSSLGTTSSSPSPWIVFGSAVDVGAPRE
jgi:ABC-type Fe3+ transport system permease subunit